MHREPYGGSVDDIIAYVEAELAGHGHPEPKRSLFHGCHISILVIDDSHDSVRDGDDDGSLLECTRVAMQASRSARDVALSARAGRVELEVGRLRVWVVGRLRVCRGPCNCKSAAVVAPWVSSQLLRRGWPRTGPTQAMLTPILEFQSINPIVDMRVPGTL